MDEYGEKPYPRLEKKKSGIKKPAIALVAILALSVGVYALLSVYGVVVGTATVTQAIEITLPSPATYTITAVGGDTVDNLLQVKNNNLAKTIPVNFNSVEVSVPSGATFGVDINVSYWDGWSGSACTGALIINPKNIGANTTNNYCARAVFDNAAVGGVYVFNASVTP